MAEENGWVKLFNIKDYSSQAVSFTYTGNGNSGESYPNEIPITDSTKIVIISRESDEGAIAIFIRGSNIGMSFTTSGNDYPHHGKLLLNWDDERLTWYAQNPSTQLNVNNATYHCVNIG